MTIARVAECNWAHGSVNELDMYSGVGTATLNNDPGAMSAVYTFSNAIRAFTNGSTASAPRGRYFSTTQIISGVFLNHGAPFSATARSTMFLILIDTGYLVAEVLHSTNEFSLNFNGTPLATAPIGSFTTISQDFHLGIACKADPSAGFANFYVDGNLLLSYSGALGNTIEGVFFGGFLSGAVGGYSSAYWGNFYTYTAVGEAAFAPPAYQFFFVPVDTAGFYSGNWNPAGDVTNVACVDEYPSDEDTTYTEVGTVDTVESFVLVTPSPTLIPVGMEITAIVPTSFSKRADVILSTLTLGLRESGGSEQLGTEQDLGIDYTDANDMFETNAALGAWTLPQVTGLEVMIKSTGAF